MTTQQTLKPEDIDNLIHSNRVRILLPHDRVRLLASIILEALYEKKGLDPKEVAAVRETMTVTDLPEDDKIDLCWQLLLDGDAAGALKAAKEATLLFPDSAEAWYISGLIRREIKDYTGAESDCSKAIQLNPSESVYHCELGAIYEDHGEFGKALNCYERASRLSPKTMIYRCCIGIVHYRLGNLDKAKKIMEEAMANGGGSISPLKNYLALCYNDCAIVEWVKTENGFFCVSEHSADHAIQFLDKALALECDNKDLIKMIERNKQIAIWAKNKHWGLSIWQTIKGGAGALIFSFIVAGIVNLSTGNEAWGGVSFFLSLGLWAIGNFKNGWKINSDMIVKMQQA